VAVGGGASVRRLIPWRPLLVGGITLLGLVLIFGRDRLSPLARELYALESSLYQLLAPNVLSVGSQEGLGLLVPLLLGMVGATAPCQLSTGVAAISFVAREGERNAALGRAAAFVGARVVVYLAIGALVLYLLPVEVAGAGQAFGFLRRLLGPLTVLVGLVLLRVFTLPWPTGSPMQERLGAAQGGVAGAAALGLAYSLAFCPTLFLLFFGYTMPLAVATPIGFLYPAFFALGMSLPLLAVAATLPAGPRLTKSLKLGLIAGHRRLTPLAGLIMLVVGVLDTIVYWSL
jgi:cytochrome c-type biogenesis protein